MAKTVANKGELQKATKGNTKAVAEIEVNPKANTETEVNQTF